MSNTGARTGVALYTLAALLPAVIMMSAPSLASARPRHVDPRAYQANAFYTPLPAANPSWRMGLLRRGGCSHSYPMAEGAGCGTATGGPAGGIN